MNTASSKITYFLAVYEDENKKYWTTFADFECLVDQGDTIEEAIANSASFLDEVAVHMVENNETFPEPSKISDFKKKLDSNDGEPVCLVPITVYPPAKTERIQITGKGNIFAEITDYAKKHHLTRSDLMIQATLDYIKKNQ
jgi:predicted RNase H-like HicB family nuclease